jgi:hypothetical protein
LIASAAGVYAHGDVAGLFIDAGDYGAGVAVEAVESVVVSDGLYGSADYVLKIDIGFGGDFSGDDDKASGGESFAGDAAEGILDEAGVQDGVGNLIGDLIGMAFGNGFGSKQNTILCGCGQDYFSLENCVRRCFGHRSKL